MITNIFTSVINFLIIAKTGIFKDFFNTNWDTFTITTVNIIVFCYIILLIRPGSDFYNWSKRSLFAFLFITDDFYETTEVNLLYVALMIVYISTFDIYVINSITGLSLKIE